MNIYISVIEIVLIIIVTLAVIIITNILSGTKSRKREKVTATQLSESEKQIAIRDEKINSYLQQLQREKDESIQLKSERDEAIRKQIRLQAEKENLAEKLETQMQEMKKLREKFTIEFENAANKILKQNSEDFTSLNQKNIGEILNPLKEKIQLFEQKVTDTYEKGLKDQTDLKAELKKLRDMNQRISEDADHLTKALKGDVKKQGNWGEVILDRVLEFSGLTEGREYKKQYNIKGEEGQILQPDILIMLPGEKHIIVDSKVSLVAYEKAVNAINDEEQKTYTEEHIRSIRSHIKELNEKHYEKIPGLNTPDFVLLFIPLESSFSAAIQSDNELFAYAWSRKVVIVSPSTLLATLRTIASVWQQENQTRNTLEIAQQGGRLYDKFVNFIKDLEQIGTNIDQTKKNYDAAMNKLQIGRGNLVHSAEKLRELGAKTAKKLPEKYSD
ncbi:MAG: DNA recombination protein RmuC [Prolixibacteraceae bacterium]|nr:DNA recombination protein RmuC [Prolixibacteraceae bacterium]